MDSIFTPVDLRQEPLLRINHIRKRFGGIIALKDFSLSVAAGHIVGLMGPNGAGKTTLVDIVSGRHAPDGGDIFLGGRRINGKSPQWIGRQGLVRTFQDAAAPVGMSVTDYLTLARPAGHYAGVLSNVLRPLAASRHQSQARKRAMELLIRYGLAQCAGRPCGEMSVGEWKFVTLLRAFDRQPLVLLLDEPSSALSTERKASLADLSKHFASAGGAIILVSHDMEFTRAIADEIVHIEGGENRPSPGDDVRQYCVSDPNPKDWLQCSPKAIDLWHTVGTHRNATADPGTTDHPTLSVRGLDAEVDGRPVLRDVCFDLWDGDILGVIGSNGAGKSTLLKSLLGLTPVMRGSIAIGGRALEGLPPHRIARAGLGLALQGARIPPRLTVEEAIAMAWARGNPDGSNNRATSAAWETLTDSGSIIDRMPLLHARRKVRAGLLSGGEQQLLAIAMAIAHRPAVLMLDEPSIGLQRSVLRDLFAWVGEFSRQGIPFIIVEQDLAALFAIATWVVTLAEGRIVTESRSGRLHDRSPEVFA